MIKKIKIKILKSQKHYIESKKYIPGGTQLFSKRPELFLPNLWPSYFNKSKGSLIWDLDNKKYYDFSYMGVGANILGYCDNEVDKAVHKTIQKGNMTTLNAPEELELTKLLLKLHPWFEAARFCKTGGEACTLSVRIARASTKKNIVLFCGYHGWHDWYLSTNLKNSSNLKNHLLDGLEAQGVDQNLHDTAIPFQYNNIKEFKSLVNKYRSKIAAVIMEPLRNYEPSDNFLQKIRTITKKEKIIMIFDETSSGFRITSGGAHKKYNVFPDMVIFGKGMSNGYSISAILGTKKIMKNVEKSFVSSLYWTERIGFVAAIATIKKFQKNKVWNTLISNGKKIQNTWKSTSSKYSIKIDVRGIYPLSYFEFLYENKLEIKTFFIQEMLKLGFLSTNAYYASYSHTNSEIDKYQRAVDKVFKRISELGVDNIGKHLESETSHGGFKRLN